MRLEMLDFRLVLLVSWLTKSGGPPILWSYLNNTRADQSDACSSFLINCYDRQPHEDLAPGWSERVVGTTPTVYWTRRVGLWLVSLHTSSHTILVVTWSDLIGLHSWLQRYKSHIGMTPDPSSLLRRGWPPDYWLTMLNLCWSDQRDEGHLGGMNTTP